MKKEEEEDNMLEHPFYLFRVQLIYFLRNFINLFLFQRKIIEAEEDVPKQLIYKSSLPLLLQVLIIQITVLHKTLMGYFGLR
jgi:hypothetical protein